MSQHVIDNSKLFILIVLLLVSPLPLLAHEALPTVQEVTKEYSHILKCNTACHKVKNIALAKKHRTTRSECRNCHIGIDKPPISPFLPPDKVFLTGSPGSVRRPDLKFKARATKKKPVLYVSASANSIKIEKSQVIISANSMTLVPSGQFIMGSNERWDDEAPEYIESVGEFYIDLYEVTNADYKKFATATQREAPYHWPSGEIPKSIENHPVTYVNWYDADEYCKWRGKRLPTEHEWEKAARGNDGNIYPWGNIWTTDKSNHPYKGSMGTEPVGAYPSGRSPYGLYDMSGNVWEWVDSFYLPHPGNTITRGEYGEDKRVLKGGSWFDCLSYGCGLSAPTFNRSFFTPEVRNNSFGFRCAKSS